MKNFYINNSLVSPSTSYELTRYTLYEYMKSLTEEEKKALFKYSLDGYMLINQRLREVYPIDTDDVRKNIELIDSALSKFIFLKPLKVTRKIFIYGSFKNYLNEIEKKGFILDKGFQSTSLSTNVFNNFYNVLLEIDIYNPFCGAFIAPICSNPDEEEFLIKRDTKILIKDYSLENNILKVKGKI